MHRLLGWCVALALGCATTKPDPSDHQDAGLDPIVDRLAAAVRAEEGRNRVAVVGFADLRGATSPLSTLLTDRLVGGLAAAGGLVVIERSRVEAILEEQAFNMSGVVDVEEASELGTLAAADVLVVGTVTLLADAIDVTARAVVAETGRVLAAGDARLPREPLAAYVDAETPVAPAPPLALSTIVFGERETGGRYEEVVVREGTSLSSGDGLKIVFETNRDAHVYALLLDSQGKGSVIFPHAEIASSNRVSGGRQVEIPPGDQWFFLDEQTGTETIYVLASVEPMADVGDLARRLEALGAGSARSDADQEVERFAGAPLHRGIGGIKKGGAARVQMSDGGFAERARDLLTGSGAVVRAISFEHQ